MPFPDLKDRNVIAVFLVFSIVIGYFGVIVLIAYADVTDSRLAQVIGLVTAVQNAFMLVVGYYFGSSAGSQKKTDLLSDMTGTGDGTSKTTATIKTESIKTVSSEAPPPVTPPAGN